MFAGRNPADRVALSFNLLTIMNPNWLGVLSSILAIVSFPIVYRIGVRLRLRLRCFLVGFSSALAVPGASFSIYYAHLFREPSWYFQFRSISGTELLIVLVGVAGGLIASMLPQRLWVLPFFVVVLLAIVPSMKPFIGPIPEGSLVDEWDGDICLQSTPSTCGAASVATILKHFGGDVRESELAAEAHSYSGGTESWYLARSIRARGYDVKFDIKEGFAFDIEFPSLVGVRLGSVGHFIPILGREGHRLLIGDPLRGREFLSEEELLGRYDFTGFYMSIRNGGE